MQSIDETEIVLMAKKRVPPVGDLFDGWQFQGSIVMPLAKGEPQRIFIFVQGPTKIGIFSGQAGHPYPACYVHGRLVLVQLMWPAIPTSLIETFADTTAEDWQDF